MSKSRAVEPSRWLPWLLWLWLSWLSAATALRCYTDVAAKKTRSVECGLNTGCVKVYIDSEEMLLRFQRQSGMGPMGPGSQPGEMGLPTLPEEYTGDPVLLRGCFVLAVPDRCYNAKSGLTYCWCSTKDLCNGADRPLQAKGALLAAVVAAHVIATVHSALS